MVDTTYRTADTSDSELGNFLGRPIRVRTMAWTVGAQLFDDFNPWTAFCQNPRNINRITNFKLLRGKLHLSFKLNGNAFHYGRAIASYIPLAGPAGYDDMTRDRAFFSQDIIAASQRPHIYLDPTTNAGGEMCLPFFWFKNYMEVDNSEWQNMGKIVVHDLGTLKHANGATDTVIVQVYAWMTDVELAIPTAAEPVTLVPQAKAEYSSGKKIGPAMSRVKNDEYDSAGGIVSGPASTVAKIAGKLSMVPYIAPYAKATQMAAGAVGGIARLFGYSRPTLNSGGSFYRPWTTGNLATGALPDTSIKLSIDPKQETTIDSRVAGLDGTDELDIKSLVTRESYLTSFFWNQTDPVDAKLFSMRMTPALHDVLTVPDGQELHFTPAALVQNLFEFWHGSMEVRFQFVCSAYHKGRVKIMYDPAETSPDPAEDNVNFTEVVDLSETRDFTIKVGWGRERHWLNTIYDWSTPPVLFDVTGTTLDADSNEYNGTISMSVINELTTPNSVANNNIYVAVFVRMCDDAVFQAPHNNTLCNLTYFPPAGVGGFAAPTQRSPTSVAEALALGEPKLEPQSAIEMDVPSVGHDSEAAPEAQQSSELITPTTQDPSFFDIYPGEAIDSLRLLLKRFNFHHGIGGGGINNGAVIRKVNLHAYPYYRGSPVGAIDSATAGTVPWNYASNTVINYLTPAFSGMRGGMRWKVLNAPQGNTNLNLQSIAYRLPNRFASASTGVYEKTTTIRNVSVNDNDAAYDCGLFWTDTNDTCISANGVATIQQNMGSLEVEIPYYANLRFFPAKFQNRTRSTRFKLPWGYNFSLYNNSTSHPLRTAALVAAAEDFNLFFFTGAPPMFYVATPAP